jgi:hypothetical protein
VSNSRAKLIAKSSIITGATYTSATNDIEFTAGSDFTFRFYDGIHGYTSSNTYTTPHDVFGLTSDNEHSSGNSLKTGSINLQGVDAFVIKLSSGSNEFNKTVYSDTPLLYG